MFLKAVLAVTKEKRFRLPSSDAEHALRIASSLVTWCESPTNQDALAQFAQSLIAQLRSCFCSENTKSFQKQKERMWGSFHEFRTSKAFNETWCKFLLATTGLQPSPAFIQFVTSSIFSEIVRIKYPIVDVCDRESSLGRTRSELAKCPLTYEESNALHYVAGYVCRKVKYQLDHQKRVDMSACVNEVIAPAQHDYDDNDDQSPDYWTNLVGRGGLCHVSDELYQLFILVEEMVRGQLTFMAAKNLSDDFKQTLITEICQNHDIQHEWQKMTADFSHHISSLVLNEIVSLYVTIRGYAFASSCLEMFKQTQKKILQKKKALRIELQSSEQ